MKTTYRKDGNSSPQLMRYAQQVVEKAGVLDDTIYELLCESFSCVPREDFFPKSFENRTLQDISLPIGFDQVSTRPSWAARVLSLIGLEKGMRILEVGAGSGYVSAIMSSAGATVFGLEMIGLLAQQTRRRLDGLSYHDILMRGGDGQKGWAEHAPYDAIIVWPAFHEIPFALVEQLEPGGGQLVLPVGNESRQQLTLVELRNGKSTHYVLEECRLDMSS